jgi:hypothetical protein
MNETAHMIFKALGGLRFVANTGACSFLQTDNALHFSMPVYGRPLPIRRAKIEQSSIGTYNIDLYLCKNGNLFPHARIENVDQTQLQQVFLQHVGLEDKTHAEH